MTSRDDAAQTARVTQVIEPPLPGNVRRPRDLLRLLAAVAAIALILVFAALAVTTADGLEQDVIGVATGLPGIVLSGVQLLGNLGLLLIPVAVSIDLLVRRRPGQMVTALIAAVLGAFTTLGIRALIEVTEPARLLEALTKTLPDGGRTVPLDAALAAVVALLTVAQLSGRARWQTVSTIVVVSVAITNVLASTLTLVAALESILLGWAVGLAVRYARGTPSERPSGEAIAAALAAAGLPLATLERQDDDSRGRRRYDATSLDGQRYRIDVLDRDQEGAGIFTYVWRSLRVIRPAARPTYLSLRRSIEHEALTTYAAMAAGVPVVPLVAMTEVGAYAAAMAYTATDLVTLDELTDGDEPFDLSDDQLRHLWHAMDRMQQARIAHRSLVPRRILIGATDVAFRDLRFGEVAASDFTLDLDVAELLTTTASVVGVERAVAAAEQIVGEERLSRALPLLQPLSMSATTRKMLRGRKELLPALRTAVLALVPDEAPVEQPAIQRFSARTVLSVVGLAIAAYFLIPQLTTLDLGRVVREADGRWALAAVGFSLLTYIGASMSLAGYTPHRLKAIPTILAQFAVTYFGLFAPTLVGGVAVNTTYLQRSGVYGGVAMASVGLSQLSAVVASVLMIIVFGALAGAGPQAAFTPSEGVVLAIAVIVVLAIIALSLPPIRRFLVDRARPVLRRVIPQLLDTLQNPKAIAVGFGGNVLLNLGYVFAMVACIEAFGGGLGIPATALVLLAGTAVGSAVPTPGGIGAIEAALTAGLTAAGLDGGTAISAVLLYRIATFWLPVPIGWIAQNVLNRQGLLFGPQRLVPGNGTAAA
jgi:uncharacterized membrane protein YbhN (UPF0104 family)/tRNA A-37 threonylcarbamoyl transferase component Bud32